MTKPVVGFAGLTHLGINSAAAVAAHGFSVVGYHDDQALIARLKAGDLPVVEPGLDELFAQNKARLVFSADVGELRRCDVVYIAADVPTDDEAKSELAPIIALIDGVASVLKDDAALVVLCQVPPGFCRALSQVPQDRLIYQVETLVFGRAVERAMHPERYIVGMADPSKPLPAAYAALLDAFGCPVLKMRYQSAELAKISINFMLVASVSATNTLAEVCEEIGADWSEIAPALRLDKRIGPHAYLTPGLGISGGNLERDLRTVIDIGTEQGTDIGVVEAWFENSAHRKEWTWHRLQAALAKKSDARIAVLGLAYKENTHSTKNSPSLALLSHLKGMRVRVHDPSVSPLVVPFADGATSALDCVKDADVLVVATPWPEYRELSLTALSQAMAGRTIIDPYRMFDGPGAVAAGFTYHALGVGPSPC